MGASWKDAVRSIAPALATALGGPAAGLATRAIAGAILGKPNATDAELDAALVGATPDKMLEYRQALHTADLAFARDMEEFDLKRDEYEGQDRANAREREKVTHDWVTPTLALAVTAIFFATLGGLFFVKIPTENRDVLIQAVGTIGSVWGVVVAYYFGTSFGSRAKDKTISTAMAAK